MEIRPFRHEDALFCFKLRSRAFIEKFYGELQPEEVTAGINAYLPDDYMRVAEQMPFFIVEENGRRVGFFNLKRKDPTSADLPFLYIDLDRNGRGIGSACIDYIRTWLKSNWKGVSRLIVDTIIPGYNGGFYRKMGFIPSGDSFCEFPGRKVKAKRLMMPIS